MTGPREHTDGSDALQPEPQDATKLGEPAHASADSSGSSLSEAYQDFLRWHNATPANDGAPSITTQQFCDAVNEYEYELDHLLNLPANIAARDVEQKADDMSIPKETMMEIWRWWEDRKRRLRKRANV